MSDVVEDLHSYAYWMAALEGKPIDIARGVVGLGFYRNRQRDGSWMPVAIWVAETGAVMAKLGSRKAFSLEDREAEFCEQTFAWCCKYPVTEEDYRSFMATGKWHDDVPDVEAQAQERAQAIAESEGGTNAEPHVIISETIKELRAEADKWLASIGGEVTTKEHADKASNYADRFAELEKEAETKRVAEKEPHLQKSREVDGKWQPVKGDGADAKKWAKRLVEGFLKAEQARKLADAAAKAAQGEVVKPEDVKVKAGTRGRSVSLRTVKELKVTSFEELKNHYAKDERFWKRPEVTRALGLMAEADLNVGLTVPGAKIETTQVAA